MAKIPSLNGKTRVGKGAVRTVAGIKGAGVEGRALQQFGQRAGRAGQQISKSLIDLQDRRERAEITDFSSNKAFEYRREINAFTLEEKNRNAGTDHKEYSARLAQKMQETKERLSLDTENQDSINHFSDKIRGFSEDQSLRANNYENVNRSKHYMGNTLKRVDVMAASVLDNPDPFAADMELRTLELDMLVDGNASFNDAQVTSVMDAAKQKSRDAVINGQIRDGMKGLVNESMTPEQKQKAVQGFLDGKTSGTEFLFEGMNAKEKNIYQKRMSSSISSIDKKEKREVREIAGNVINLYENEDSLDPSIQNQITNAKIRINRLPESDDKSKMIRAMDNAESVFEFKKGMHDVGSIDILGKDFDDIVGISGIENVGSDIRTRKMIEKARRSVVLERNKDGKAYINKHFAGDANNPEASMAKQIELGVSDPRVMTKTEASTNAEAVLEETNPRDRVAAINKIISDNGSKYGFQALSEMAEENKSFHKGYVYSAYLSDNKVRENVITALSNRATNEDNFKQAFPSIDRTNLKNDIQSSLRDEILSFNKAGLQDSAKQFSEMVEAVATQKALKSGRTKGAAEEAVQEVIHKNFDFFTSGKNSLVISKSIGVDRKELEEFISGGQKRIVSKTGEGRETFTSDKPNKEYFDKLGLNKDFYTATSGLNDDEFYNQIAKNSFWAMDKDINGLRLMYTNPRTKVTKVLKKSNGSPIALKYEQIKTFGGF